MGTNSQTLLPKLVDNFDILSKEENETEARHKVIQKVRKDMNEGKSVLYSEVRKWVLSWGAENELPAPKIK